MLICYMHVAMQPKRMPCEVKKTTKEAFRWPKSWRGTKNQLGPSNSLSECVPEAPGALGSAQKKLQASRWKTSLAHP